MIVPLLCLVCLALLGWVLVLKMEMQQLTGGPKAGVKIPKRKKGPLPERPRKEQPRGMRSFNIK